MSTQFNVASSLIRKDVLDVIVTGAVQQSVQAVPILNMTQVPTDNTVAFRILTVTGSRTTDFRHSLLIVLPIFLEHLVQSLFNILASHVPLIVDIRCFLLVTTRKPRSPPLTHLLTPPVQYTIDSNDLTTLDPMETAAEIFDAREATRDEIQNLVHEPGKVPMTAWVLILTGAVTQTARFGTTVLWQNYLQNPRGNPLLPGALGLGQTTATTIQNVYLFYSSLTPLLFAVISDGWIGRYKTVLISLGLLAIGYVTLVTTSIPSALDHGAGLGGLITTMILLGLGQSGLSTVMYPIIADQIPDAPPTIRQKKSGKLVVIDRKLTIQYVFNAYYWAGNIASLSSIGTTLIEKRLDFWIAYLIPTAIFTAAFLPLAWWGRRIVRVLPVGKPFSETGEVIKIAIRARFKLSVADPEYQQLNHNRTVTWSSSFVREIGRGLRACRVIAFFAIFWLCYNQSFNNIISQAGQMEQYGFSNDTFQSLNAISCIVIGPLIQDLIYPFLRRRQISLGPIVRITAAFIFAASGMAYAAGVQHQIYSRGPCYEYPLECPAAKGNLTGEIRPNEVNVWLQVPVHVLFAFAEVIGLVALNEYIYSEAPTSMKAAVQALQLVTVAIGSALGIALGAVSKNPWLEILFAALSGSMAVTAVIFWVVFRRIEAKSDNDNVEGTGTPKLSDAVVANEKLSTKYEAEEEMLD
ncbi:major facilitator superfamily domain-containing protein [Nemania sp. FL0916]|nr:major facilitator superfamily domain-containing protein [Nemania sp. FL0916]